VWHQLTADNGCPHAPGPRADAARGRLQRLRRLTRCIRLALSSMVTCAPMFVARRPETPLRVLCVGTFEYAARLGGSGLSPEARRALAWACDFGALRNDYYDQRRLDRLSYRDLRGRVRGGCETATRRYIRALRQVERGRPPSSGGGFPDPAPVVEYRQRVLAVSLGWLQGVSGRAVAPHFLRALLALVGLIQLVDDLIDWRDDWSARRPTFVTAFLRESEGPGRVATPLRAIADRFRTLLAAGSRRHVETAPVAMAGACVWLLAVVLVRIRFGRWAA
jgi:hypothetical protein